MTIEELAEQIARETPLSHDQARAYVGFCRAFKRAPLPLIGGFAFAAERGWTVERLAAALRPIGVAGVKAEEIRG